MADVGVVDDDDRLTGGGLSERCGRRGSRGAETPHVTHDRGGDLTEVVLA